MACVIERVLVTLAWLWLWLCDLLGVACVIERVLVTLCGAVCESDERVIHVADDPAAQLVVSSCVHVSSVVANSWSAVNSYPPDKWLQLISFCLHLSLSLVNCTVNWDERYLSVNCRSVIMIFMTDVTVVWVIAVCHNCLLHVPSFICRSVFWLCVEEWYFMWHYACNYNTHHCDYIHYICPYPDIVSTILNYPWAL